MTDVTGASDLLKIGQMISGRKYDKNLDIYKTRCSIEELAVLDITIDGALLFLNSGLSAIGNVMAYCDHAEVESSMTDIGFLINGLGSLAERLSHEKACVSHEMLLRAKEAAKDVGS